MSVKPIETEVLVVGAGPAGLTATALLARQGVDAITLCKYASTAHTPRAHITNQRTMEVFRDLGVEQAVYDAGIIMTEVPETVWVTSLAGRELARRSSWGTLPERLSDYHRASPSFMANAHQLKFEPILCKQALSWGADIRFNTELLDIEQDADGVTATVCNRLEGSLYKIRARYAIGADGGRSVVAERAGFEMEGEAKLGFALNVWIEADLSKYVAHRPGCLYFTNYPSRDYLFGSGTFILVEPFNEWNVAFSYDPSHENLQPTEEVMLPRVREAIGDPDIPVKIKAMSTWEINHIVAAKYQRGRIFLAGDAAHRHPPSNGLGSNTSVQDSYNLAWKLAAVLKGNSSPTLLESYNAERQPVGRQIIDRAINSTGLALGMTAAFGITPQQTVEEGWAAIDGLGAPTEEGAARRSALEAALSDFDHGINCHNVEVGQRYSSSAIITEDTDAPAPTRDVELFYEATTYPGARLPHAWLEHDGHAVSTVDLVPADGWALLTGVGGQRWVEAAQTVADELGVHLTAPAIGFGQAYLDVYGDWTKVREVGDAGAILVRPDRHIAFRSAGLVDDPVGVLRDALVRVLHIGAVPSSPRDVVGATAASDPALVNTHAESN